MELILLLIFIGLIARYVRYRKRIAQENRELKAALVAYLQRNDTDKGP